MGMRRFMSSPVSAGAQRCSLTNPRELPGEQSCGGRGRGEIVILWRASREKRRAQRVARAARRRRSCVEQRAEDSPGAGDRALEPDRARSEEHTSELQSLAYLVCRLLLEKKKNNT